MSDNYDIVVVGGGIVAAAAAAELTKGGHFSVLNVRSGTLGSASGQVPGYLSGGTWDNFTRLSHAHGSSTAEVFWRFGDAGFDAVVLHAQELGLPITRGQRLRIAVTEAEAVESRKAVEQLRRIGAPASFLGSDDRPVWPLKLNEDAASGIQIDGDRAAIVDPARLLTGLFKGVNVEDDLVVGILRLADGLQINTLLGRQIRCELVILGVHLGLGGLVPELAPALVSYADQWFSWESGRRFPATVQPGSILSMNHTYEWCGVCGPQHGFAGGGRYLRPMAGFEADSASYEPRIERHVASRLDQVIAGGFQARTRPGKALLDCWPCDELPIVGPMFGEGRILVATGFMNSGLSMGYLAGRCLAELVSSGHSQRLPRIFWPERLRSLRET